MPTEPIYAALLASQAKASRLVPGSPEWLEATGRAQEAWAELESIRLEQVPDEAQGGADPAEPCGQSQF